MRTIAILDLQMGLMRWAKTVRASYYVAVLSGYHKAKGDFVTYLTAPDDLDRYDKVYFIYEEPELFFNAEWARLSNAVFLGEYSPIPPKQLPPNVASATPDFSIYTPWLDAWLGKYSTLAEDQYIALMYTPVVLDRNNILPYTGQNITILNPDLHTWTPEQIAELKTLEARTIKFAYPLPFKLKQMGSWLQLIKQMPSISRKKLWASVHINELYDESRVAEFCKIYKENYVGRFLRIRLHFGDELWEDETWWRQLETALYILQQFRYYTKQRITLEIAYRNSFSYPAILTMAKRWSGSNDTYWRDSPLDYFLYDTCKDKVRFAAAIQNLSDYAKNNQYLNTLVEVLNTCPERLMGMYSKSFKMQLIPSGGHPLDWKPTPEYKELNTPYKIKPLQEAEDEQN